MTEVAKLTAQLELQSAQFEAGLKRMNSHMKRTEAQTRKTSRSVTAMNKSLTMAGKQLAQAKAAFVAYLAVMSVDRLIDFTAATFEQADALAKMSDRLGVSTDYLQEMTYALGLTGVSQDEFTKSLQKMQRAANEANLGVAEYADTFEALGVELRDADGRLKSTEQLFRDLSTAIAAIESPVKRTAAAMDIFGRSGAKLINAFLAGNATIDELRQNARDLGLVLREDLLRDAETLNDRWSTFQQGMSSAVKTMVLEVSSWLMTLWDNYSRTVYSISSLIKPLFDVDVADMHDDEQLAIYNRNLETYNELTRDRADARAALAKQEAKMRDKAPDREFETSGAWVRLKENVDAANAAVKNYVSSEAFQKVQNARAEDLQVTNQRAQTQAALNEALEKQKQIQLELEADAEESGGGGAKKATKAQKELKKTIEDVNEVLRLQAKALNETLAQTGVDAILSFSDALIDGEANFKEFTINLLRDMAKLIARAIILSVLLQTLGINKSTGKMNPFGKMLGGMLGVDVNANAKGGVTHGPSFVGTQGTALALAGEAGPEAILPLKRGSNGDLGVQGTMPQVIVNNYSGENVQVSQTNEVIEIAVGRARQMVATDFSQSMAAGQGPYARAMEGSYSARRKAT